jgi:hypothetical protein
MSIALGAGEKVIREEDNVWYHGGFSRYGGAMIGKLVLTNKRFIYFRKEKTKERGGLLGLGTKDVLKVVGIAINLPIANVIGASIEQRERKKGTVNQPASLFSKETYSLIIVSMETMEGGVENPTFEVRDPAGWVDVITRIQGGEVF